VVTLQLGIVLVTGLAVLAVTQPLVGGLYVPVALLLLLIMLGVSFWRGAANLQGHVQAGAQTIVEAILSQARKGAVAKETADPPPESLAQVRMMLPGIGEPTPVLLHEGSAAVGRSLAELNLRGVTGASVLAIARGEEGLLVPTAKEVLRAGDTLALAGTSEAVAAARMLLEQQLSPSPFGRGSG
jgi:CPA2 family monovalent cation:H+ antiporter-2